MDIKRENFKRISESRVNKITDLISKLSNLINPSFYEYDDEEIDAIFDKIQLELNKQKEMFKADKEKKNKRITL